MIKKFLVIAISLYQIIISPLMKQLLGAGSMCRFTPTCSEYAKISIKKYGAIKGLKMGLVRLLHCQPLSNKYANI